MGGDDSTIITSHANPLIKRLRKLRDRKEREVRGQFYAEGLRIISEAADYPKKIDTVLACPELIKGDFGCELLKRLILSGVQVAYCSPEVFQGISLKDGPQGLAAAVWQEWKSLESVDLKNEDCWVVLEGVSDPGNLGTILRTLDAVGGKGVILLENTTDPYDPSAIRASMGAVFSQQLVKTTLSQFISWKNQLGYHVVGTSDAAELDYHYVDYPAPFLLMMGSERQGLSDMAKKACDLMVSIPMSGRADSLNLAVATAVVLYEWFNTRRDGR